MHGVPHERPFARCHLPPHLKADGMGHWDDAMIGHIISALSICLTFRLTPGGLAKVHALRERPESLCQPAYHARQRARGMAMSEMLSRLSRLCHSPLTSGSGRALGTRMACHSRGQGESSQAHSRPLGAGAAARSTLPCGHPHRAAAHFLSLKEHLRDPAILRGL